MLHADACTLQTEPPQAVDGRVYDVQGPPESGFGRRAPEPTILDLRRLLIVAEICGRFRFSGDIEENREITAHAQGVEIREEEIAIAAQEILDVVLRRRQDGTDSRLLQQIVEVSSVEWDLKAL